MAEHLPSKTIDRVKRLSLDRLEERDAGFERCPPFRARKGFTHGLSQVQPAAEANRPTRPRQAGSKENLLL